MGADVPAFDSGVPAAQPAAPPWATWTDDQLLELRFCDLDLSIEGSWLEERIDQLHAELEARGITFRPYFWLSDEWFTPDGVHRRRHPLLPGASATLQARRQPDAGGRGRHAGVVHEDPAPRGRPRHRQRLPSAAPPASARSSSAGSSRPYPEYYTPKPYSKSFVLHLDSWYAQSHPAEDFAETFAVWLTPDSQWRTRYADWPALKKLEYIDELMRDILPDAPPIVSARQEVEPISHPARLCAALQAEACATTA